MQNSFKPWKAASYKLPPAFALNEQGSVQQSPSLTVTFWDLSVSQSLIHLMQTPLIVKEAIFKQQCPAVLSHTLVDDI